MVFAEPFLPEDFAGLCFETVGHTAIGNDVKPITDGNRRRNIGDTAIGAPNDFAFGDVAVAVRFNGENMVVGKAAGHEQQVGIFVVDDGRHELFGGSIDHPMKLAVVGIVTGDTFVSGEDHLGPAVELANQRDAIAAGMIFAGSLPNGTAVLSIQGNDVGIAIVVPVHDHKVFVENRRAAEAVHAGEWAWTNEPALISFEIVSSDQHLGLIEKGDINKFSVGSRSAGSMAVQRMLLFHGGGKNRFLPENLSSGSIQAEENARLLIGEGGDGKKTIVPNNGRGVPN